MSRRRQRVRKSSPTLDLSVRSCRLTAFRGIVVEEKFTQRRETNMEKLQRNGEKDGGGNGEGNGEP